MPTPLPRRSGRRQPTARALAACQECSYQAAWASRALASHATRRLLSRVAVGASPPASLQKVATQMKWAARMHLGKVTLAAAAFMAERRLRRQILALAAVVAAAAGALIMMVATVASLAVMAMALTHRAGLLVDLSTIITLDSRTITLAAAVAAAAVALMMLVLASVAGAAAVAAALTSQTVAMAAAAVVGAAALMNQMVATAAVTAAVLGALMPRIAALTAVEVAAAGALMPQTEALVLAAVPAAAAAPTRPWPPAATSGASTVRSAIRPLRSPLTASCVTTAAAAVMAALAAAAAFTAAPILGMAAAVAMVASLMVLTTTMAAASGEAGATILATAAAAAAAATLAVLMTTTAAAAAAGAGVGAAAQAFTAAPHTVSTHASPSSVLTARRAQALRVATRVAPVAPMAWSMTPQLLAAAAALQGTREAAAAGALWRAVQRGTMQVAAAAAAAGLVVAVVGATQRGSRRVKGQRRMARLLRCAMRSLVGAPRSMIVFKSCLCSCDSSSVCVRLHVCFLYEAAVTLT